MAPMRGPNVWLTALVALGLLLIMSACGCGGASPDTASEIGADSANEADVTMAFDFTLDTVGGEAFRLSDSASKVHLIDFWATWCAPCVRELPELVEYHERLEGRRDVTLLSFNVTDGRADLQDFLARKQVPFRVFLGDDLIGPYELVSFPTKLVIDMRNAGPRAPGVVRFRREGYTTAESIEARVEELLAHAAK